MLWFLFCKYSDHHQVFEWCISYQGEVTTLRAEANSKAEETGVLKGRLLSQSEEVERLRKALHEAEQRKPALPEQPSAAAAAAATVQQQLLHTMETSELRVKLATAEEGRQEVERQLGALQRQVQLLEEEMKQGSQKVSHFRLCTRFTLLYMCVGREVVQCKVHWPWSEGSHRQ